MWDNFIGRQIRRCNRNLLLTNLLLLGAIVAYIAYNSRYLVNFVRGAEDISNTELANIHGPTDRARFFVSVHGEKSFDSGIQSIEQTVDKYTNKVESTKVNADYRILVAGNRLLIVKADPQASGETFTGALEPIPPSVYDNVVRPAMKEEPTLEGAFLPVMLNANDYREEGWWTLGVALPLLALIGWNIWKWQRRSFDFTRHPIYWRLTWFGPVSDAIERVETAMRMNQLEKIGKARIYGPWLFTKSTFGLTYFHLPDVVWLYQKVTRHYTNLIPTGKSFSVLLNDRHGYTAEIRLNKKSAEALMGRILQQNPWIIAGYTDELKKLWGSQRAGFIAAVDQRRAGASALS